MSKSLSNYPAKRIRESTVCGDPASEVSESTRAIDTATVPDVVPKSYTPGNIWFVVGLVSLAGLASPFPATIYFPSLSILTQVFHETTERLNLTLTVFLVPMAVFPMVWGPLSDRWGRRPCIVASLVILTLTCVGLALVPTNAFWLLMFLRFLQSAGCTGTVALGAGAIADITTRADRGGYFGAFNVGPMVGPCVGPVIGGLLAQYLGWRSIFWFLAIFSAVLLALLLLFLPETLPCIVGDGSIRPSLIYRPWIKVFRRSDCQDSDIAHRPPPKPLCNPFSLIAHLDILVGLFYASVSFAIQYSVSGTLANAYKVHYPFLNSANVGLCYLANGGGLILGAIINGRLLDFDYRRARDKFLRAAQGKAINGHVLQNFENFPLESVRLKWSPHFVIMYAACVIGWGWCVEKSVFLAGPLILQVALGFASISIINTIMTLMVDLIPNQSSSITACVNFMRASLAAILISVQDQAISGVGYGWTYTILGAICALMLPMVFLEIKIGPNRRGRRRQREAPPASV